MKRAVSIVTLTTFKNELVPAYARSCNRTYLCVFTSRRAALSHLRYLAMQVCILFPTYSPRYLEDSVDILDEDGVLVQSYNVDTVVPL